MNKGAFLKKAIVLAKGETLPESQTKGEWFEVMKAEKVLICITRSSRRIWRAKDETSLRNFVADQFGISDLEGALESFTAEQTRRADLVASTGDSKFIRQRTFTGFLVNCYQPIKVTINSKPMTLSPEEGTFTFIFDYEHFSIPEDVIVVGVENAENFRYIKEQRKFFEDHFPENLKLLFVSRYPQNQSADLIKWLGTIPNRYVHFGDLDLAGISIYLNEFYKHLGERASLLIPKDFETRITKGSTDRYNDQYERFHRMILTDPRVKPLMDCINKHHKGYDQEGFISH